MQSPNSRDCVVPLRLRQRPRCGRNLPCPGNPHNLLVGRDAAMQIIQRSLQQAVGNHRVPAYRATQLVARIGTSLFGLNSLSARERGT